MASNTIDRLIDAIGDTIGSSRYKEDLKIAQQYAGLTFDRQNYERYRDKTTLRYHFSEDKIRERYEISKRNSHSEYVTRIGITFSMTGILRRNGFIFTKEIIDAIPDDIKKNNYDDRDIIALYKVAELQKRGIPIPDGSDWGKIYSM